MFKKIWGITKDKRMIIVYALSISLWPKLGKENRYFYTRHSNNNDRWVLPNQYYTIAFEVIQKHLNNKNQFTLFT